MSKPHTCRIAASMLVTDADGRILLVREGDPRAHGKLNLPGGHMDAGESIPECATREVSEETGLAILPEGLLCICQQELGVNFVFQGYTTDTDTTPGEDILSCEWFTPDEILALANDALLHPRKMHMVLARHLSGERQSIDAFCRL